MHPVGEVSKVLRAWLAWAPGTREIERAFSFHQAIFASNRRGRMSRRREQDVMTLVVDYDAAEAKATVDLAIEVWKQFFFNVRPENKQRKLNARYPEAHLRDD